LPWKGLREAARVALERAAERFESKKVMLTLCKTPTVDTGVGAPDRLHANFGLFGQAGGAAPVPSGACSVQNGAGGLDPGKGR